MHQPVLGSGGESMRHYRVDGAKEGRVSRDSARRCRPREQPAVRAVAHRGQCSDADGGHSAEPAAASVPQRLEIKGGSPRSARGAGKAVREVGETLLRKASRVGFCLDPWASGVSGAAEPMSPPEGSGMLAKGHVLPPKWRGSPPPQQFSPLAGDQIGV